MMELLAALCVGLAVGLGAFALARQRAHRPADRRIRYLAERPKPATQRELRAEELLSGEERLPFLRHLLTNSAWAERTALQIEQAGLKMRAGEFLMIRIGAAVLAFVVVWAIGRTPIAAVIALVCAAAGWLLPAIWLKALRQRRIDRIAKQLPEAVSLIANSLRAGFAFQHGVDLVAQQLEPPITDEFTRLQVDMNLGASVEEALQGLMERAESEDMNLVVTAILIQRTSGGNLAEILETVGETMRERERLYGEVRTMTAQQRFSGTVLTVWPMILLAIFTLVAWDHTSVLFTTQLGLILLMAMGFGQLLGYYSIRRILDVDI